VLFSTLRGAFARLIKRALDGAGDVVEQPHFESPVRDASCPKPDCHAVMTRTGAGILLMAMTLRFLQRADVPVLCAGIADLLPDDAFLGAAALAGMGAGVFIGAGPSAQAAAKDNKIHKAHETGFWRSVPSSADR